jgi:hypothetical protein
MKAGVYDLTVEQGTTWSIQITWKDEDEDPINLTGYTARMHIRPNQKSTTKVELTTENGRIALGGAAGTITLTIPVTETRKLTQDGIYDLEVISGGGLVTRLLEGRVDVTPEVTR